MNLTELLQAVANAIRTKKGTTGTINAQNFPTEILSIPKGSGNAQPSDVLSGKTFTNSSGEQTGVMPYRGVAVQAVDSGQNSHGVYYHIPSGYYNEDGTNSWVYRPLSDFGNASASDVLSGKTFTSSAGLKVSGNMANRGAWGTTINPGGSVTIPSGYHNGSGVVSANSGSNPTIKYHSRSSTDGATSLAYTFDSYGKYRVFATASIEAHNGNQVEFYTNGTISSTHYSNMWSKGGGTYGGIGEDASGTTLIFFGDIIASSGNQVKILTKETKSFITLCVEKLAY